MKAVTEKYKHGYIIPNEIGLSVTCKNWINGTKHVLYKNSL